MRTQFGIALNKFTLALLVVYWLICASFYPSLPDQVPTHWNLQGQVDGYSHKVVAAFIMPALPLFIYVFMTIIPKLDPKRENYQKFAATYEKIRLSIVALMGIFTLLPLLSALGYDIDVSLLVKIILPFLFIIIGNYMGKIRFNYFTGIRVPWTLASEEVWNKTHRLGGKLMVAGGFIGLLSAFAPPTYGFVILMAAIFAPLVIAIGYSYLLFRGLAK